MIDSVVYAFSADNKPVHHAALGSELIFKTKDCFSNKIKTENDLITGFDYNEANPASGPVFIEGVDAGDILVVDILDIKVGDQGVITTLPGCGPLHETQETRTKVVHIKNDKALFNDIEIPISPMIGVIGVAPKDKPVACGFPGRHGGNMDCRFIQKGVRLYFPVNVAGALFALGDLHAIMGDGELCGTGLEIAGEVKVRVNVIKNTPLEWPVLETKDTWYTIASDHEYPVALKYASTQIQQLISKAYGWDLTDCYLYLTIQGNVEICQACKPCAIELVVRIGVPKRADKPLLPSC